MSTMLINTDTLEKVATFVATATPIMEKWAAVERAISGKSEEVVDFLVQQGIIPTEVKDAKVLQFKSSPEAILDTLKETAAMVKPAALGGPVEVEKPSRVRGGKSEADLAFERTLLNR